MSEPVTYTVVSRVIEIRRTAGSVDGLSHDRPGRAAR